MSFSVKKSLNDSFSFVKTKVGLTLLVFFWISSIITQIGVEGLVYDPDMELFASLLLTTDPLFAALIATLGSIMSLVLIYIVLDVLNQDKKQLGASNLEGAALPFLNLFVGGLVLSVLVFIGTLLLIIPGVFIYLSLAPFMIYVVVDRANFFDAFKESWMLMRTNRIKFLGLSIAVFALGTLLFLTVLIPGFLAYLVLSQVIDPIVLGYALGLLAELPFAFAYLLFVGSIYSMYEQIEESRNTVQE